MANSVPDYKRSKYIQYGCCRARRQDGAHRLGTLRYGTTFATNSDALFVNHNMVVELVFEYVRRAVFPHAVLDFSHSLRGNRLKWPERKEGQALYRVESSSIFRADQSWLTLGVQNAIASLSAHRYWSGASSGTLGGKYSLPRPSALWSALPRLRAKAPIGVWFLVFHDDLDAGAR